MLEVFFQSFFYSAFFPLSQSPTKVATPITSKYSQGECFVFTILITIMFDKPTAVFLIAP